MLRELLNEHRWHSQDLAGLELTVRHRGAPGDIRVIPGFAIASITANGVNLVPADGEVEGVFIPFHRVLRVGGPEGETLWARDEC
ncbi:MAG: DUF504 domain-containing protein [Deltaproteobacteria bacterium]|nr:MAG: DUF504 domain-containing protein [Deltaproteobacteria bacterium]